MPYILAENIWPLYTGVIESFKFLKLLCCSMLSLSHLQKKANPDSLPPSHSLSLPLSLSLFHIPTHSPTSRHCHIHSSAFLFELFCLLISGLITGSVLAVGGESEVHSFLLAGDLHIMKPRCSVLLSCLLKDYKSTTQQTIMSSTLQY